MCVVTYFQHKDCKHIWAVVTEPCGPWMGFSTCRNIGDGTTKETPKFYRTKMRPCPRCAEDIVGRMYDRNAVRVVDRMGWGVKFGTGPDEDDWGVDVRFGACGCVIL
ncbi:hypothetical protein TOPH_00280 [Tolypocladium ophioglossoides CBS 100239]|uniref:Uncharacterized protein n=1 Tax=Tolypocladium ophioglossoides (strain CBS 100239) TaxID=1163406 RepID=A0A0L0NLQ8_TOLOC|nr:hypothetical protein TOPH_00280 [Tolypocladium ophioglossoides CBS 100239]